MYAAHVILRPGVVIVYGDLGEWILRHSEHDSLAWMRGAVGSRDYLLSKVCRPTARFWPDEAARMLASSPEGRDAEDRATLAKVAEQLRQLAWGDTIDPYEWGRAWMEAGSDGDYPRCEFPSEAALWLHALLKAFVEAVDREGVHP